MAIRGELTDVSGGDVTVGKRRMLVRTPLIPARAEELEQVDGKQEWVASAGVEAPEGEAIALDYRATGLSLEAHPMSLLRPALAKRGALNREQLMRLPNGRLDT